MSAFTLKYSVYNAHSILIEWPHKIDDNILQDVLSYKNSIESSYNKVIVEVINTYSSLLIIYDITIDKIYDEISALKALYKPLLSSESKVLKRWEIPVCYEGDFATDLHHFSEMKKLSISEIIERHSQSIYKVCFIGFLPGFLYLSGLDSKLYLDRKSTPNLSVKKGSVAIGGMQTGIYPSDSPGGWHIIGNTPISFFDPNLESPCFAEPGDEVVFKPIGLDVYKTIEREVLNQSYTLKWEAING